MRQRPERGHERIREREKERERHADECHRIEQAGDDEHSDQQCRSELRLTGNALEKTPPQDPEADRRAERSHPENQSDSDYGHSVDMCNVFHSTLLKESDFATAASLASS